MGRFRTGSQSPPAEPWRHGSGPQEHGERQLRPTTHFTNTSEPEPCSLRKCRHRASPGARGPLTGAGALLQRLGHQRVRDVLQPRSVLQPDGLQPEERGPQRWSGTHARSPRTSPAAVPKFPGRPGAGAPSPARGSSPAREARHWCPPPPTMRALGGHRHSQGLGARHHADARKHVQDEGPAGMPSSLGWGTPHQRCPGPAHLSGVSFGNHQAPAPTL